MFEKLRAKATALFDTLKSATDLTDELRLKIVTECKDPLADWLDKKVCKILFVFLL